MSMKLVAKLTSVLRISLGLGARAGGSAGDLVSIAATKFILRYRGGRVGVACTPTGGGVGGGGCRVCRCGVVVTTVVVVVDLTSVSTGVTSLGRGVGR